MSRSWGLEFDRFLKEVLPGLGLDWRRHRRRGVRRRVAERMRALGLRSLGEYQDLLARDLREKDRLKTLLGVTISRFFRDAHVFDYLADKVWPAWEGRKRVVFFSAGCAGGEEPYSLAIHWQEKGPPGVRAVILALDIDEDSLTRAREGFYTSASLKEVPEEVKARWFRPEGRGRRLIDDIKAMVCFYRGDLRLLGPPPGLDLALCRNLAYTYFSPQARHETTSALARALKPGGRLVVGAKEKIEPNGFFEAIYPCVYRVIKESRP